MNQKLEDFSKELSPAIRKKVNSMDEFTQDAFIREYKNRRKSGLIAFILTFFFAGTHYLYIGKIGMMFLFWCTGGGIFMWWFIDLFRINGVVKDLNGTIALEVLSSITQLQD